MKGTEILKKNAREKAVEKLSAFDWWTQERFGVPVAECSNKQLRIALEEAAQRSYDYLRWQLGGSAPVAIPAHIKEYDELASLL